MNLTDVYIKSLVAGKSKTPDRNGLYTALQSYVLRAPKSTRLTREEVQSKLLTYAPVLKRFSEGVDVTLDQDGYRVIPALDMASTYVELKYGSAWYEIDGDVDAIVISRIFWGTDGT